MLYRDSSKACARARRALAASKYPSRPKLGLTWISFPYAEGRQDRGLLGFAKYIVPWILMDTRQLAAFCAVVEKRSFSQAAERLGVTQPAVSLQVRALEERLGQRLIDRSGRRVEPTEAGLRVYRNAQRLLELEQQLIEEVTDGDDAELGGTLAIGASTGPGAHLVPLLLCEFQRRHPHVRIALSIFDTYAVIDKVAARELELGVVGALRRHRSLTFDPLVSDEIVLAVPPGHPAAGGKLTPE